MSTPYDRRAARREAERQRTLCGGETLADYHARERGALPTASPSRAPCRATPDMFTGLRKGKTTADLFDQPTKQRD